MLAGLKNRQVCFLIGKNGFLQKADFAQCCDVIALSNLLELDMLSRTLLLPRCCFKQLFDLRVQIPRDRKSLLTPIRSDKAHY
jgi:hypothetical protein